MGIREGLKNNCHEKKNLNFLREEIHIGYFFYPKNLNKEICKINESQKYYNDFRIS